MSRTSSSVITNFFHGGFQPLLVQLLVVAEALLRFAERVRPGRGDRLASDVPHLHLGFRRHFLLVRRVVGVEDGGQLRRPVVQERVRGHRGLFGATQL